MTLRKHLKRCSYRGFESSLCPLMDWVSFQRVDLRLLKMYKNTNKIGLLNNVNFSSLEVSMFQNSYSQIPVVLPYDSRASEGCLGQLPYRVERRLKRE
ncbi:MAG: hypothetical protein KKB79_00595 [Nanoarchaeota archaeon]|nr:hypothetical protein [Nanoarchaeota archaeon]